MDYAEMREKYKKVYSDGKHVVADVSSVKEGIKHDIGKSPCELLSPQAMLGTAAVLAFGAKKNMRLIIGVKA